MRSGERVASANFSFNMHSVCLTITTFRAICCPACYELIRFPESLFATGLCGNSQSQVLKDVCICAAKRLLTRLSGGSSAIRSLSGDGLPISELPVIRPVSKLPSSGNRTKRRKASGVLPSQSTTIVATGPGRARCGGANLRSVGRCAQDQRRDAP